MSQANGLPWRWLGVEALEALSDNRLRTALSLLGVAIGIASIIVVSSIAASGKRMVFEELETFGLRTFWVFRDFSSEDRLEKDAVGSGITNSDYRAILHRNLPLVEKLSPVVEPAGEKFVVSKNGKTKRVRLQGVNHHFQQINGDDLVQGRFFSEDDVSSNRHVAVIGPAVHTQLFAQSESPIGQTIGVGNEWYMVIGVLEEKSRDLISSLGAGGGEDTSARILIPYTTRQRIMGQTDFVSYLQGQASDLNSANDATSAVSDILTFRHQNAFKYKGESMASYVSTANRILSGVSIMGVTAAAVSLLVGGLAIMNIMSTSVIERTREIGLRRAIGATQMAIRMQFLLEAVLISAAGGLIGIALGLLIVQTASATTSLHVEISLNGLGLAMLSTFAVGIASGYFPALTASKLEPVEALRHE